MTTTVEQGSGPNPWTCICHGRPHPTDGLAWLCEKRASAGEEAACCSGASLRSTSGCG